MSGETVTGYCPYQTCSTQFVEATTTDVGEHFRTHLPYPAPTDIAGLTAIRLMDHRRTQAFESEGEPNP